MFWQARRGFIVPQVAALSVPGGPPTWTTTFSQLLGTNSGGWSGFNMRQWIGSGLLSTSGSLVRATLQTTALGGCSIDSIYIGHQAGAGDPYDFDGGQVQLLVSGSGSFSIGSGASVVTDAATFALDHTKNLIIAAHFNATSAVAGTDSVGGGNLTNYFKSGASESSVSNVSSYSSTTFAIRLVNQIEVQ